MKHIKLYENKSVQSIRKNIDEFNKFRKEIRPYVIEKYKSLIDDDYYPECGSKPRKVNEDSLVLNDIYINNGFEFELFLWSNQGEFLDNFNISISNEEMEQILLKMTTHKYNL